MLAVSAVASGQWVVLAQLVLARLQVEELAQLAVEELLDQLHPPLHVIVVLVLEDVRGIAQRTRARTRTARAVRRLIIVVVAVVEDVVVEGVVQGECLSQWVIPPVE